MICCERKDGTKYRHRCGCPSASLITQSVSVTASLCGHEEYTDAPAVASVPPKKYRKEVYTKHYDSGMRKRWEACFGPVVTIDMALGTNEGGYPYYYDPDTGDCTEVSSNACATPQGIMTCVTGDKWTQEISSYSVEEYYATNEIIRTIEFDKDTCVQTTTNTGAGPVGHPETVPNAPCDTSDGGFISSLGYGSPITTEDTTPEYPDPTTTEKKSGSESTRTYGTSSHTHTTSAVEVYWGSGCISQTTMTAGGQTEVNSNEEIYTLSDEDTEADALARATPEEGRDTTSRIEVRGATYCADDYTWTTTSVKHAVLFTGLVKGKTYTSGGLPVSSREIDEDWEAEANIPISNFVASDTFEIVDGTLNVTPEEFKGAGYSLSAGSYPSLSAGDDVITANKDLAESEGHEYTLSVSDADTPLYIDPV